MFTNTETRELFFNVLIDLVEKNPRDPLAHVREFLEMTGADSAVDQLARRLKKDLTNEYARPKEVPQDLLLVFMRAGLRQVKWCEVSEQFVRFCQPAEAKAGQDFDDLGYGPDDLV
jgi:hypothetical protein